VREKGISRASHLRGPLGIRLSLPKEGGRAIGEYDQHNHKHAPDVMKEISISP
jgi:hypothetical protein